MPKRGGKGKGAAAALAATAVVDDDEAANVKGGERDGESREEGEQEHAAASAQAGEGRSAGDYENDAETQGEGGEGGVEGERGAESMEARHRREMKELQHKVQALKKTVTKGDNKKKKQVTAEMEQMQSELESRHKREREAAAAAQAAAQPAGEAEEEEEGECKSDEARKPTRAQRRREKKESEAVERNRRIQEEMPTGPTAAEKEMEDICAQLQPLSLSIKEIRPDGHCLFRAVCEQLPSPLAVEELRRQVADTMLQQREDFLPFMTREDGEMMSAEEFEGYCERIASTSTWGGQHELQALSVLLQRPIRVFQAGSRPMMIGEGTTQTINLSYHRAQFRLGEHYNAVVPQL